MPIQVYKLSCCGKKEITQQENLAKKDDVKSAYHQMHLHHEMAVKTVTQTPELKLALMSLRLTFGGTLGPFKWGIV
jgi:hypothetical protein